MVHKSLDHLVAYYNSTAEDKGRQLWIGGVNREADGVEMKLRLKRLTSTLWHWIACIHHGCIIIFTMDSQRI